MGDMLVQSAASMIAVSPPIHPNVTVRPKKKVHFGGEANVLSSSPRLQGVNAQKPETCRCPPRRPVEGFETKLTMPNEAQVEVTVTTKVRTFRRSKSAIESGSLFKMASFQAYQRHMRCVGTLAKSMEDISGKAGDNTQMVMENTIASYLQRNGYKVFHRKLEFLVEGDDFFNIFSFLSQVSGAKEYPCLATVPNWTPPYSVDLRHIMIDAALETDSTLFGMKKTLRKGYLLNAAAKFSRPRVIKFLYNLIRRLVQGPESWASSGLKYKLVKK